MGSLPISRATALQLAAVAVIGTGAVVSGGTLAPLLMLALSPPVADVVGKAVEGLIPNLLSGLFSDKAKQEQSDRDRARRRKQNHHVQGAINEAIALCVKDAAETSTLSKGGKDALSRISAKLVQNPLALELTPGTDPIDEAAVTAILTGDARTIRDRGGPSSGRCSSGSTRTRSAKRRCRSRWSTPRATCTGTFPPPWLRCSSTRAPSPTRRGSPWCSAFSARSTRT
jgi:hypothetical protein